MGAVKVELVFNSYDEAIVALGKMAVTAPAANQPAVQPAEPKTRKGRSDAGQPRGPNKQGEGNATAAGASVATASVGTSAGNSNQATTDTGKAATQAVNPASTTASTPGAAAQPAASSTNAPVAAAPVQPKAPAPSPDDVQKAVEKLFNAKGFEDCAGVLSRFGVKRGKDLAEDQRADFIAKTERVIAGEAI